MPRDLNYMSHGLSGLVDQDLLEAEVRLSSSLPWLRTILQEVQYLRRLATLPVVDSPDSPDSLGSDSDADRVIYLETVLDKIGASYVKQG